MLIAFAHATPRCGCGNIIAAGGCPDSPCMLFSAAFLSPLEFLIFVLLIFLTVFFFMAGLSYGISMLLPNEVIYETVMNAIVLPLFFLSNALFPTTGCTGFAYCNQSQSAYPS